MDLQSEGKSVPEICQEYSSSLNGKRDWIENAIQAISADQHRSGDTHLIKLNLKSLNGVTIYLKDESTHPSGSLKHRLARSLFLYGLCNGRIGPNTPIVECSSGSTAISEAYFANLLGIPFIAVVPESTSRKKTEQIEFYGGECRMVPANAIYAEAEQLSHSLGGHYMDQFTFAERATDWRGNNNIAESLFSQMQQEPHPVPTWVVMSAGTGGTSATIGRYIRYKSDLTRATSLCVADPEHSVFYDYYRTRQDVTTLTTQSRIEGIGRPRVEPSFLPQVIDRMLKVPDAASIATIWWLEKKLGRRCGGSTGTNLFAALQIAREMRSRGQVGSIVTMICDSGDRYADTYYDAGWLKDMKLDLSPFDDLLPD